MDDEHLDWPDWVNQGEDGTAPPPNRSSRSPGAMPPPSRARQPGPNGPPPTRGRSPNAPRRPPPDAARRRAAPGSNPEEAPTAPQEAVGPRRRVSNQRRGAPPGRRTARASSSGDGPPAPAAPRGDGELAATAPTAVGAGGNGGGNRRDQYRSEKSRRRRRRVGVLIVLALLLLPFLIATGWFWWQVDPLTSPGATVEVELQQDWGVSEIGDELSNQGVIGSAFAFQIYAKVTGGGPFQAGTYELQKNMGARAAIDVLEDGPAPGPRGVELALPPGLTIDDIAARVQEALPNLSAERFIEVANSGQIRSRYQPPDVNSLEGLLYPATYTIGRDAGEEDIIQLLVDTFDERATEAGIENAPQAGLTPYEAVIVASLIQNETGIPEELPLVSAVIRNRLEDGDLLQIDYTLCYVKGGCPPAPTNADKEIDSPYNTYMYAGLPPTPISSVTAEMITAAVSPADVDYKFYVLTDEEGHHAFATTNDEHEANIADAQRRGVL